VRETARQEPAPRGRRLAIAGALFRGELSQRREARRRWASTRLAARIHELRQRGLAIVTLRRDGATCNRLAMRPIHVSPRRHTLSPKMAHPRGWSLTRYHPAGSVTFARF
jgi:hypothetical protein